jgi:hypothetical protein
VKVLGRRFTGTEEKLITKLNATYGDGLMATDITLHFTTHAIEIYELSGFFSKEYKQTYNIPLDKISEVYRKSNLSGNYIYYISTPGKDHPIYLKSEPYKFLLKLSTVLQMDGSLYNFDLLPEERVRFAANGDYNNSACTIYMTNKRLIVTKMTGLDKMASDSAEGKELVVDLELSAIKSIKEVLGMFNADYIVNANGVSFTLTFNKEVPKEFLALVPGAFGNKQLLEKKKKAKTGLKIAAIAAAAFVGGSEMGDDDDDSGDDDEDYDDEDYDDEMDDMEEVDMDGDGDIDAVGADMDGDGEIDTVGVDADGDGELDTIGMDTDGDGEIDTADVYLIVLYCNKRMVLNATQLLAADADGNGKVNTTDAYYIVLYYTERIDKFPAEK